jgi:hypothetical protein
MYVGTPRRHTSIRAAVSPRRFGAPSKRANKLNQHGNDNYREPDPTEELSLDVGLHHPCSISVRDRGRAPFEPVRVVVAALADASTSQQ